MEIQFISHLIQVELALKQYSLKEAALHLYLCKVAITQWKSILPSHPKVNFVIYPQKEKIACYFMLLSSILNETEKKLTTQNLFLFHMSN